MELALAALGAGCCWALTTPHWPCTTPRPTSHPEAFYPVLAAGLTSPNVLVVYPYRGPGAVPSPATMSPHRVVVDYLSSITPLGEGIVGIGAHHRAPAAAPPERLNGARKKKNQDSLCLVVTVL